MAYQFQFGAIAAYAMTLLDGLWLTVLLAIVGIVGGFVVGLLCATASTLNSIAAWAVRIYVEIFRNTPMLVQLFVLFFGLPSLGVRLSPQLSAFLALVLNNGAYVAEIIRAGIAGTGRGQFEAGTSLGLGRIQTLALVVLPPAIERVYAPIVSQSVLLMLSTSIVSAIGVEDLTGVANLISSETFRTMEVYLFAAIAYLALNYLFRAALAGAGFLAFRWTRQRLFGAA